MFVDGNGGVGERVRIDEIAINSLFRGEPDCGFMGELYGFAGAPGFYHHWLLWTYNCNVCDMCPARQDEGKACEIAEEVLHQRPVGLVEVVAGWRPFPPTAVGRII